MKKILVLFLVIFLSACSLSTKNTPKQTVTEFLDKYRNEHTSVMEQLKDTIESQFSNDDYKKRYTTLMTNQYKNMEYRITDEVIEDNNAVVDVEVTVLNYGAAIKNAEDYLQNHRDEFKKTTKQNEAASNDTDSDNNSALYNDRSADETTRDNDSDNDIDDDKYMEYRLNQMENVTDTVRYTVEFNLTKNKDGKWEIDSLSDTDIEKLHGIYVD